MRNVEWWTALLAGVSARGQTTANGWPAPVGDDAGSGVTRDASSASRLRRMARLPPLAVMILVPFAEIGGLSAACPAFAQTPSFPLSWEAPPQCPEQGYVRSTVEQLLAGGASQWARVEAHARVERGEGPEHGAGAVWRVRLTTVRAGVAGERVVESTSCRSLADATALIVALTVDPEHVAPVALLAGTTPTTSTLGAAAEASPPPTASARAKEAPASLRGPPPASRVAILAQASGDSGILPQPMYGFTAAAAIMFGAFRVEGYGSYEPAQSLTLPVLASSSGDVQLVAGGLRGCLVPWRSWLEIAGCSGLEVADMHVHVQSPGMPTVGLSTGLPPGSSAGPSAGPVIAGGVGASTTGDSIAISATVSARAAWRLTPSLGLIMDAGLAFPLWRQSLGVTAVALSQPPALEGRAAIGPELRF